MPAAQSFRQKVMSGLMTPFSFLSIVLNACSRSPKANAVWRLRMRQVNIALHFRQLTRLNANRSNEHKGHVALLDKLAGDATKNCPPGSATTMGSHHDQGGFVLSNHLFDAEGSIADAHIRIDGELRVFLGQSRPDHWQVRPVRVQPGWILLHADQDELRVQVFSQTGCRLQRCFGKCGAVQRHDHSWLVAKERFAKQRLPRALDQDGYGTGGNNGFGYTPEHPAPRTGAAMRRHHNEVHMARASRLGDALRRVSIAGHGLARKALSAHLRSDLLEIRLSFLKRTELPLTWVHTRQRVRKCGTHEQQIRSGCACQRRGVC